MLESSPTKLEDRPGPIQMNHLPQKEDNDHLRKEDNDLAQAMNEAVEI